MWYVEGTTRGEDVVSWRYLMRCGCGLLDVLDDVWMWSV